MKQQDGDDEFDIIVVGAGPSAAGLLYGLLTRVIAVTKNGNCRSSLDDVSNGNGCDSAKKKSSGNLLLSNLRIAILERGGDNNNNNSIGGRDSDADMKKNLVTSTSSSFEHTHPSTHALRDWFQAAHFNLSSSQSPSYAYCAATSAAKDTVLQHISVSPTVLHTTTPQSHLSNRIIDVPTGTGWGGGTNINAGLVMRPYCFHDNDWNNDWPGRWKGGDLITCSMEEIWNVMRSNGGLLSCCDGGNNLFLGSENNVDTATNKSVADVGMISAFQQPTLAAASTTTIRRVNYFTSLIEPLLKQHPELLRNLHFLSQAQVERILIRFSCDDQYGDDDNDSDEQQQQQQCKCKPQAWAVECNIGGNYRRIIRSRREIILCTGAIATPSLLLASGIGMEDDLRKAGIAPWYDEHNIKCCNTSHIDMKQKNCSQHHHHYHHHHTDTLYRNLQVGHNLRDHVLLPRTFVSSRRQCDDISAGAISSSSSSWNSIQGWWMINVPKTNTSTSSIHDDDAKIQLQLADGIQMDYMIPHFAAASLRRRWTILNIDFPLAWIGCIFLGVRAILRVFFGLPVISKWIQQHTTSLNLCLLNPKSVGRVTIVRSSSRALKSSHARLSECNIVIDPNYLSDSEDVENLWRGWNYSSSVKKRQLKSRRCLIEILPGYTLSIGLAICSCISSAMHWLMWALFIVGKPHDEMTSRYGGNVPNWFLTYVAEFSNPYYHWCGSCAMGEEVDSSTNTPSGGSRFVVDENLCVRGLSNLRICDASVFPNSVSGPIALTCAALGHSASSIIIEE